MKGRTWTAKENLAIVLEGITGPKPMAAICRAHQIAQRQYYQWLDRFLEGGKRAMTNRFPAHEEALKREISRLSG
ncbi:MAG: transposase [Nitrospirae bacterium]|nr:MAG: transposase [Nitrospirota bacterium]